MRVDPKTLADGGALEAQVVVAGAGPSGIVTALELARAGVDVVLVESGGDAFDARTQHLGDEARRNEPHVAMELATRRQLGGATNLWGGRCLPFDPIDFEDRPDLVGDARWPVTYADFASRLQRAADWCVIGEAQFDAQRIPGLAGKTLVPGLPDGDVTTSTLERWSLPTNFGREYREALNAEPNLRVVTGLTVTRVAVDDGAQRVTHLEARTLDGRRLTLHARRYVLAIGGVESTRLLLASEVGNPDHLGRHYMAHVDGRIARVRFTTPPDETIYSHERDPDGVYVRRRFAFTADKQRRDGLPNMVFWLVNPELGDARHGSGILSFVYLALISPAGRFFVAEGIRKAHVETPNLSPVRRHLRNVVLGLPQTVWFALSFGYSRFLKRGRRAPGFFVKSAGNVYTLNFHGEHLPHPDSRLTLSETETDELGLPRLDIDLRFDDRDTQGVLRAHEALDAYLREHGVGELEYFAGDRAANARAEMYGGYHQSGTTRMSERPEDGVVDGDLAVHGFDDLYVAAGSTFPTSGQANTTFTEVLFALRLADHLRGLEGARPPAR